jgi:hypothetical protein
MNRMPQPQIKILITVEGQNKMTIINENVSGAEQ